MLQQRERFLNYAIQLHFGEFRGRRAREIQQRIDNLAGAESLPRDLFQNARLLLIFRHLLGQHLGVGRNHGERRIHLMRHARRKQPDTRKLVGLHQAALQFGAIRHVVEDHQAPDPLHVAGHQRRDRDVHDRFAVLGIERRTYPGDGCASRRACARTARPAAPGNSSASVRPTASARPMPLSRSIWVFQLSTRSSSPAARMPTLIDSTMFSLNSFSRSYSSTFCLSEQVEVRVLRCDPDVIRKRLQQFDIVARKELAGLRPAHAEIGDGPAAHRAGQIVVEIEIGDASAEPKAGQLPAIASR